MIFFIKSILALLAIIGWRFIASGLGIPNAAAFGVGFLIAFIIMYMRIDP